MKNIFLLLIMLISLVSFSQDKQKSLNINQYYYEYSLGASDTVSNNDTLWYAQLFLNKTEPIKYDIQVKVDSLSGTPTTDISLQGKVFESDSWTNITTVSWAGTTSDTTFTYTENSTAKYYRYLRVYNDANTTAQKYKINYIKCKIWDK